MILIGHQSALRFCKFGSAIRGPFLGAHETPGAQRVTHEEIQGCIESRICHNFPQIRSQVRSGSFLFLTKSVAMSEKLAPDKRHCFMHNGQKVFEWDQTLEEANIYISLPQNVPTKLFYCKIQPKHLEVGIKGSSPYLNHDLTCPVKVDSSFWTLEDDVMHITLQKRDKGQTWPSPIYGQGELDPLSVDHEQRRLMLQRFQEEHPGFDFSQAEFTGICPDPKTFMGGIQH